MFAMISTMATTLAYHITVRLRTCGAFRADWHMSMAGASTECLFACGGVSISSVTGFDVEAFALGAEDAQELH
jgi:hypothetical protein